MASSIIVIPTYNERENIAKLIPKVFEVIDSHVLIIEDSSPDKTAEVVRELQKTFPNRLFMEERQGKLGLGTAYIHGFKWALQHNYTYIMEMDADFSHDPESLPELLSACEKDGHDVAIGSRYITGVNVVNWPMSRVLMSYFASVYVRWITRMPIRDTTAGFKCYRRRVLEKILQDPVKFVGYAFQIEMKFRAWKYGFSIVEVPIIFRDRQVGESKISQGIIREAFWGVVMIKISSWFKKWK